ncbi:MAG: CRISPR-associated endonuclease Cas1 [Ferruginibacter sp.]
MHLIIDNYGVKIEVEDEKFKIAREEDIRYLSPLKLSSINILKPCSITTAALVLAAKSEVPVLLYDERGHVEAWVWSPRYGTIADIRITQAGFVKTEAATTWIIRLMQLKAQGHINNLKWLAGRIKSKKELTERAIGLYNNSSRLYSGCTGPDEIRHAEAQCSRIYWDSIAAALEKYILIPGRIRKGAEDRFNISLNYMYGILYGQVEASLLMKGLDPSMGILHINRHARPALAFDHIEPFRPWVDKLVMELFMSGFAGPDNFTAATPEGDAYSFTSAGKRKLVERYFMFMEERSYLLGKRIKNKDHIHYLSSELVTALKKFKDP